MLLWLLARVVFACAVSCAASSALAQESDQPKAAAPKSGGKPLEEVVVIGVTPTQGSELDADKLPARVQQITAEDLAQSQALGLTDYLDSHLSGVSVNAAQNNPLQPDVQYRGFTASPLLGLPQGLAVYQGGVRINEPLGDSVNWDLLPQSAVSSVTLVGGANPLFGLNTLGGALNMQMKNGFNAEGHELSFGGGAFGRVRAGLQSGGNDDRFGYYFNTEYFDEDGWRDLSNSDALNLFGALSYRGELADVDLNLQYADTDLRGNGAAPESLLDRDRASIFTAPDITENRLYQVSLNAVRPIADRTRLSGTLFWRQNHTRSFNGDASEFRPCDGGLCEGGDEEEGEEPGEPIELGPLPPGVSEDDLAAGRFDAINNLSRRTQVSYGGTLQLDTKADFLGRENDWIAGVAYFQGKTTRFKSRVELARLDGRRSTNPSVRGPVVLDESSAVATAGESYSSYFADSLSLTERFSVTLAGRYNLTRIHIGDRSAEHPEVEGDHGYRRFNPSLGLAYKLTDHTTLYAGYSESSRAPTPIELSCNEGTFARAERFGVEQDECRLPNAFLADPPLDQVVAKSWEGGIRNGGEALQWSIGGFFADNHDDIIFQSTGRSTGVFKNVDQTRRYGVEAEVRGTWSRFDWFANYSFVKATFQDRFTVQSPNHPLAQDLPGGGRGIFVRPGDRIPGTPEHRVKLGGAFNFSEQLSLGLEYSYASEQYFRGDESNQLKQLSGYGVFNLNATYRPRKWLELSLRVENLFNRDYETFGLLGERAEDLPGIGELDDVRFVGAAPPRAIYLEVTLRK